MKQRHVAFNWSPVAILFPGSSVAEFQPHFISSVLTMAPISSVGPWLLQGRQGAASFRSQLPSTPSLCSSTPSLALEFGDDTQAVILAYQHSSREQASKKTWGRLKSMGCITDDARAWVSLSRIAIGSSGMLHPADCYIGAGSKQHGLCPRLGHVSWRRPLA